MPTTTGPGASWSMRAGRSRALPTVSRKPRSPGAGGTAHRRRQRLVLVVRGRPFVGPRPRIRRAVPPARPERLSRARETDTRRAVRHQHHDAASDAEIQPPTGFIQPVIDGEVTSYFEWVGAGCVEGAEAAGAMHQVSDRGPGIAVVEFGFDLENVYIRVDGPTAMREMLAAGYEVSLRFLVVGLRVVFGRHEEAVVPQLYRKASEGWSRVEEPRLARRRRSGCRIPDSVRGSRRKNRRPGCAVRDDDPRQRRGRPPATSRVH